MYKMSIFPKLNRLFTISMRRICDSRPLKAFTAVTMSHVNIQKCEKGQCLAELTISEADTNFFGTLHGGFTATIIDEITTLALISNGPNQSSGMSVNLNINYMAAAHVGDTVVIEATTSKCGKTLAFLNCTLRDKKTNRLIAEGAHTKFVGTGKTSS